MNRLNLVLPAFIVFVLFAPNFVSANGIEKLLPTKPVEKTVQTTDDTVKNASETAKEIIEESEPFNSTVETVKEVVEPVKVEPTSITDPITEPVEQVVKETGNTVEETTEKIDESLVKPVVEPISESVMKPVEKTVETVRERSVISETVGIVEETVQKTEEKLKESPVSPVSKDGDQSETSESKPVDGDKPTTEQKVKPVPVEESDVELSVETTPNMDGEVFLYQTNDLRKREQTVRKVKEPVNNSPFTKNRPLNKHAITAQPLQAGNPSVSVKSSSDLGVSAFLESLKMDFTAEVRWSNPEEAGKSQWSHAPPGQPPKFLSFI